MSIALSAGVTSAHDSGVWNEAYLIRFEFPTGTVGYVAGPRPFTYNGITHKPNRYLTPLRSSSRSGFGIQSETVTFSDVPTEDASDSIASIEALDYQNAQTITSTLVVEDDGTVAGVAETSVFEIADVEFLTSAEDEKGDRTLTLSIELEPQGRAIREQSGAKRSLAEQLADNDATDNGHRYAAQSPEWPREWGQIA